MVKSVKNKKKKKSSPIFDYIAYLLMRLVGTIIQVSHVRLAIAFANFLGRGLYKYYGRGRERALENLRASYPEKSDAWIERVARASFEQLARLPFEVFLNPRLLRPDTYMNYFEVDHEGFGLTNPFQEINVVVTQNDRWDNALFGIKPLKLWLVKEI